MRIKNTPTFTEQKKRRHTHTHTHIYANANQNPEPEDYTAYVSYYMNKVKVYVEEKFLKFCGFLTY